ncbi:hypothetical protein [Alienimonas chondri]|uniref:DUF1570 domain-containing protein n=1 Tax=Alienimonas chondri TaxID=2681879 RepID=A0ABX1VIT2_9PLAN|nr:hypothetical protein [Alienimonas chondri]NNJ27137.1 hypothetical protein [Alienimonas chondri]
MIRTAAPLFLGLLLSAGLAGCTGEPAPAPTPDVPVVEWPDDPAPVAAENPAPAVPDDDPAPVVRPVDREPPLPGAAVLAGAGLTQLAGDRLTVVTDRPEHATGLPALIEAAWPAWVDYFGAPPPRRNAGDAEADPLMTAFLMAEPDRFRSAGVFPDDLPPFLTGRQRGRRFWMYDVEEEYFRRSLTLHEATHVFMGLHVDRRNAGPLWYLEGMAERFGAHRIEPDGSLKVRVIPGDEAAAGGWDRLERIRADVQADSIPSIDEIASLSDADFLDGDRGYAWSWALVTFLDAHPAYAETFRTLSDPGRRGDLSVFNPVRRQIDAEWPAFATELVPGYDVAANAVQFRSKLVQAPAPVSADQGWQAFGSVRKGQTVTVNAAGRFTLADDPKPWESTADGISFDYHRGQPIGQLQAAVLADAPAPPIGLAEPIPVGAEGSFVAPRDGTLYLRINDRPDRRADNRGGVTALIELE